jgi:hypothetical protein
MLQKKSRPISRPSLKQPDRGRFQPALEALEERIVLAITASFSPSSGILSVLGDAHSNTIVVSRDAAGQILIHGGDVAIQGGAATVANTALIQALGRPATTRSRWMRPTGRCRPRTSSAATATTP